MLKSMNLWLVTSIRVDPAAPPRASSIQNLQTAMALAELGHSVLVWVAALAPGGAEALAERLGRPLPAGVRLFPYEPRGPVGEKKTPFASPWQRWGNIRRARQAAPPPDAVITRSPRIISQLSRSWIPGSWLLPRATRLVLEYQYPEWAQLWRAWRRRQASPPRLREAVAQLRAWRRQEDAWLRRADGVLYAARGHEPLLRRAGCTAPALWLPSGCLTPGPAPAGDEAPGPEFEIGYAGTLAAENGLEGLLEALKELPHARLLLVGGGSDTYLQTLRGHAFRHGVMGRITFQGAVGFHEVRAQMRRCQIGVVPISRRQGPEKRQFASPLKLIEWMAAGVPVVATAVPSVAQFAHDGCDCLLAEPGSPAALAGALGRLLLEPELAAELAAAGRATAANAAWPQRARRIAEFIETLK